MGIGDSLVGLWQSGIKWGNWPRFGLSRAGLNLLALIMMDGQILKSWSCLKDRIIST